MKLTKEMWFQAGKLTGMYLIAVSLACISWAQAVTTTTVQGTVYQANGAPSAGTLQVSWPAFTTASSQTITAGRTTVSIGADGFVSVNLAPNLGSSPAGLFYTAVYHLSDGTTSTEYWVVPAAAQASLAQVRAQVMPAAQAVQAVDKAYVDQAIQLFSQTSLSPSGGTLSGPLYLSADPAQALQAADKHYVDSTFSQAVPLTGASLTGPLTSVQLGAAYQVDQFPGTDFGGKLQACLAGVSPVYGGTCDARNFTGNLSMASNLTISTANTTIMLPCATISTASQLIVTAGTRNVALRGCALRGASNASGSQGGTVFLYSGTGAMLQVGDPTYAADTLGFHLDNVVINTTSATSSTTEGLAAYRTQELDLQSLYFLGNSNQTGMTLDGTGNYTGGTFYDIAINGFQTAVNAIGHQVSNSATTDWLNASTFVRLHIDCPMSGGNPISGTYGINLQQGDGNTFTGGDVEGCNTALHLGTNAQNNTIVGLRNENSNNQIIADAGSSYNNWMTGGTMFTGKLTDNGTRNSFLDTFHRSFNGINGDWYGSQQDATVTNHFRLGVGAGIERGLLNRYQTDFGYRWTTGLSDAIAGEQFYQIFDELNNVYRLSIGQYNNGQPGTNNQTVINAAGTGAVLLNGSNNSGTGGVVIGSGGANVTTVATINNAGNAQFNGTLQVSGPSTFSSSTSVRNQSDAEIDSILTAGATTSQKESFTYKDYNGASQWYMVKDASNNWALNSAIGGLDSFKAYQSSNSGDTYINASNPSGLVRVNYENGAGTGFSIYGGNSSTLYASFTGATSIKLPGLAAGSGHNCLQIDNSGYVSNTGTACGSGGGSGTVNSGATGQIAYYNGSGTALSGMSTIPVSAGGTGASSAASALTSLGGASLATTSAQSFAGPVNGPAVNASVNTQINVMAPPYNAKGDCTTDDHDAILAAMTAAAAFNPPSVVYFPKPSGGCYLTSALAWNGASLQGQPGLGTTYNTAGVSIQGKPGEDVFEVPSPSTVATAAPNRTWSIRDLRIVVDDSTAGSFPHRWPGRWVSDAAMTAGSAVFTSSNSLVTCGDIGQAILVKGAGASGADLSTTISNVSPCWANSLAPTSQVITLATPAATSVSADMAYVSVAGLPVTADIGACGIAFDDFDGNQADFTMNGKVGNLYDTIRDVSFNSVGGGYGKNSSCGLYFQGWWGPYGLDARNVNVGGVYYGVVEGSSDTNPSYATGGNDFQKWDHGIWSATYPWISYNGAANKLEDIQIQSLNGPQILQFGNIWSDAAGEWYINMPEFAHVNGGTNGWRVEGSAHTLVNTLLGEDPTYTQPTYFDANDSQCINCSMMGAMTINGSHNRFSLTSDLASEHITDNSLSNVVTGSYLSSPTYGYPVSRFYAVNNTRGDRAAGTITDDFIKTGNVATPYMSNLDLFFWPDEFVMNGAFNAPSVSADSNSLTGRYIAWYQNLIVSKFTNAAYLNNGGTALIGSKMVPASQGTVYISAACPTIASYTLSVYADNTSVASNTFSCSPNYATQSLTVNLASFSGTALGFKISGTGSAGPASGVNVAYIALSPFNGGLNMSGPINFGSTNAASSTLASLGALGPVINLLSYGAKGDCSTDDSAAFSTAITAAGSREVYIPKPTGGCYLVNTPTTVPTGATITFAAGAVIKTPVASTWTISGTINAGRWQIFNSGDVVSFSSNASLKEVFPEWWGADPTGNIPSAVPWQDAVNSVQRVNGLGGVVSCPNATYSIENTVTSFAPDTASGVSLIGPDSQNNASSGACALKYTGPVGGTVFHYIGGHQGVIKNITFNANGIASRGLWLDSANGAAPSSAAITSVVRSCKSGTSCATGQGNVVTVTTASVPASGGWLSGTDITLSGIADTSFDGVFPVWYQVDTTHYVFSQGGPLASSNGGTAAVAPSGDIAGIKLEHVGIYAMASQTASISSCSVTSNVESCTLSAPVLQYPNEWTWTSGSSDPTYNAYWKLTSVNSATTITATATVVSSEASTSSGTFQGPSSAISLGSNQLSLVNNSVCCTDFDDVAVSGYGVSPTPLVAYEWDGSANTKDFLLKNVSMSHVRIGFAAFATGGYFECNNCAGGSVTDALYAASVQGNVHIFDAEWEQIGTAYIFASLPSGSYNAFAQGTSGQFELNNSTGTVDMDNVRVEALTYAPDGVALSIGGNVILKGNIFGYIGDTASHVTSIVTATAGSGQTPGTYQIAANGGGGSGALISVIVAGGGTVTQAPTIISQGSGYTSAPTFTLAAGGTPATFTSTLGVTTPLINMQTYYASNAPSSLTSLGNTYYYVPAGSWVPVIEKGLGNSTYTAYGSGSRLGGASVTTFGDFGSDPSMHIARLSEGSTLTELRYAAAPSGTPLDDASVGFPKMPNNVPGPGWRNAADNSDCWLVLDTSNSLDEDCGSIGSPIVNPLTTQGNTFNGNNQLVQTGAGGTVPASVLPPATTTSLGGVKCDGTTITCTGGVITAAAASSSVPRTLFSQNTSTVVNSTTSETALFTGTIPANTVGANSNIHWTATFTGETSASTCTFKGYLNSSASPGGFTLFTSNALASGSRNLTFRGDLVMGNSLSSESSDVTYNYQTGSTANSVASGGAINMGNSAYFIVTGTPGSSATDSAGCTLNNLHLMLWP